MFDAVFWLSCFLCAVWGAVMATLNRYRPWTGAILTLVGVGLINILCDIAFR